MDYETQLNLGFLVAYFLLAVPCVFLFIIRRNIEPIRSRNYHVALLQMIWPLVDLSLRTVSIGNYACLIEDIRAMVLFPVWIYPYFLRAFALWFNCTEQKYLLNPESVSPVAKKLIPAIQKKRFFISPYGQFFICLWLFFVISAIIGILVFFLAVPLEQIDTVAKPCETEEAFVILVTQIALGIGFTFFFVFLLYPLQDSYFFKQEFIATLFLCFPLLVVWLASASMKWKVMFPEVWINMAMIANLFGTGFMPLAASFVYEKIMRRKSQREEEASMRSAASVDDLALIFGNGDLLVEFERFSTESWAIENVMFYKRVEKFKNMSKDKARAEARKIYDEFIDLTAACELNVDMFCRDTIKERLATGRVSSDLFDEAERQALDLLRFSILPLWKRSASFKDVMKKMKATSLQEIKETKLSRRQSRGSKSTSRTDLSLEDFPEFNHH